MSMLSKWSLPGETLERQNKPQHCIVCDHAKSEGIALCGQWICQACEAEMVQTEVEDARYGFFIERLRKLWLK